MKKITNVIIVLFLLAFIVVSITIMIFNLNIHSKNADLNNSVSANLSKNEVAISNLTSIKTNSAGIAISPNALVTYFKHYKGCGHTIRIQENVSNNMVNLTRDELANLYSDWQINKFTPSEIELYKDFSGSCNEHYFVRDENGFISIYNVNESGDLELNEKTEIATKYFSPTDIADLKRGVKLYTKENLNAYLENFE